MKCQNCGKSEVNFHYSSNINGVVTERHLCSDCAAQMQGELRLPFSSGNIMSGLMPGISRSFNEFPAAFGFIAPFSFAAAPQLGILVQNNACETTEPAVPRTDVDDDMKKRREINIIKEQMRIAVENEDFEKAAELRNKIKDLEK